MLVLLVALICTLAKVNADNVDDAKKFLSSYGYYHGSGDITKSINEYQKNSGISVTGVINEETINEMHKPRCGFPDKIPNMGHGYYNRWITWFRKNSFTYRFESYGSGLGQWVEESLIRQAFAKWSAVANLRFTKSTGNTDFVIKYRYKDGPGGKYATGYKPYSGVLVFDTAESWAAPGAVTAGKVDYLFVAIHEIGHLLGLLHSPVPNSIMLSVWRGPGTSTNLAQDDILGIRSMYGQ